MIVLYVIIMILLLLLLSGGGFALSHGHSTGVLSRKQIPTDRVSQTSTPPNVRTSHALHIQFGEMSELSLYLYVSAPPTVGWSAI